MLDVDTPFPIKNNKNRTIACEPLHRSFLVLEAEHAVEIVVVLNIFLKSASRDQRSSDASLLGPHTAETLPKIREQRSKTNYLHILLPVRIVLEEVREPRIAEPRVLAARDLQRGASANTSAYFFYYKLFILAFVFRSFNVGFLRYHAHSTKAFRIS